MHTRTLEALTRAMGFLILFGGIAATAAADSAPAEVDVRTSRSSYLLLADPSEAPERVRPRDRRIRLRYDKPVQVGGSDLVLRLKASPKKKKLLSFEVLF